MKNCPAKQFCTWLQLVFVTHSRHISSCFSLSLCVCVCVCVCIHANVFVSQIEFMTCGVALTYTHTLTHTHIQTLAQTVRQTNWSWGWAGWLATLLNFYFLMAKVLQRDWCGGRWGRESAVCCMWHVPVTCHKRAHDSFNMPCNGVFW